MMDNCFLLLIVAVLQSLLTRAALRIKLGESEGRELVRLDR